MATGRENRNGSASVSKQSYRLLAGEGLPYRTVSPVLYVSRVARGWMQIVRTQYHAMPSPLLYQYILSSRHPNIQIITALHGHGELYAQNVEKGRVLDARLKRTQKADQMLCWPNMTESA